MGADPIRRLRDVSALSEDVYAFFHPCIYLHLILRGSPPGQSTSWAFTLYNKCPDFSSFMSSI